MTNQTRLAIYTTLSATIAIGLQRMFSLLGPYKYGLNNRNTLSQEDLIDHRHHDI